jgi:hypothetical protein
MHLIRYYLNRGKVVTQTHVAYRAKQLIEQLFPSRLAKLKLDGGACHDAIAKVASALKTDLFALGVTSEPKGMVFGNVTLTYVNGNKTKVCCVGPDGEVGGPQVIYHDADIFKVELDELYEFVAVIESISVLRRLTGNPHFKKGLLVSVSILTANVCFI